MLIANPIYDSVFKYLMEDTRVAKRLLSILTGEEILEIETRSQEQTLRDELRMFTLLRLDFVAVVLTKTGERKKILIELQKGKQPIDILRFRRYIGQHYTKQDVVDGEKTELPLLVVYFLGFKLGVQYPVLKVNRVYRDAVSGKTIEEKDAFIEKLSHDCFVVQIPLLPQRTQNKVEKVLSVFNQKWVKDEENNWIMNFQGDTDDEDLNLVTNRLHIAAQDEEVQQRIEAEEAFESALDNWVREQAIKLEQKEQLIVEKEQQLEQKEQQIEELKRLLEQEKKKKT